MPQFGSELPNIDTLDLSFQRGQWGAFEAQLTPPVSLLSWLIRNGQRLEPRNIDGDGDTATMRRKLVAGDPATIAEALKLLRTSSDPKGWHIFEGPTCPDAFIETPDALLVVEGKRTEPGATTHTSWMDGRHQMWRHIDAAWEIRGRRKVFGFFVVNGDDAGNVPELWKRASLETLGPEAISSSFPHRSAEETLDISNCFLGITTWQQICVQFGLLHGDLPETTADVRA
jgi:hypothetical protein